MKTLTITILRQSGVEEIRTAHLTHSDRHYTGEALISLGKSLLQGEKGDEVVDVQFTVEEPPSFWSRMLKALMRSPDRYRNTTPADRFSMFHMLWTACTGTDGYVKDDWRKINKQLEAAGVIGTTD